jgi:hypothetical protein
MKRKPYKSLWALFDHDGDFAGTYDSKDGAKEDAVGPRFRPSFSVRRYDLVKKKDEKR